MIQTITKLIHQELLQPEWEMTRQLLAVMNVALDNGLPKIDAIVINEEAGTATGYVAVKDEAFYIGVHFVLAEDEPQITAVDTEPSIFLSFSPSSDQLSAEELRSLTTLKPTSTARQGEANSFGDVRNYSALNFESSREPGAIEDKLTAFLTYLAQDTNGIKRLIEATGVGDIWVAIGFHISNRNFTRLFLTKEIIAKLNELGLTLTFDLMIAGTELPADY